MTDKELWQEFCESKQVDIQTGYEAWAFGGAPDKLAQLVLQGTKTGTASAYELYDLDDSEPMPKEGDYSVILNSKEEAVCVIRTTKLYTKPFDEVSEEHARKEGEGDKSLAYWRTVHEEFFSDCLKEYGRTFDEKMPVLCEEFEVVYRPQHQRMEIGEYIIEKSNPEDAEQFITYLQTIGKETDNLTFGEEGLPITVESERAFIESKNKSSRDLMIIARKNGKIVADASIDCLPRRMSHRASIGISVLKEEWGKGLGSILMKCLIEHAKNVGIEIISLEVRSDNERAIHLYEKFGFKKIGVFPGFFKMNGEYVDFDLMNLNVEEAIL